MRRTSATILTAALVSSLLVGTPGQAAADTRGVQGTVTDSTGAPVANACVTLFHFLINSIDHEYGTACSGADGRYAITGLPDNGARFALRVQAPGLAEYWYPQRANHASAGFVSAAIVPTTVDVRLGQTGTVRGRISYADGTPALNGTVWLNPESSLGYSPVQRVPVRVDGTYEMTGLPIGRYRVRVDGAGVSSYVFPQYVPGRATEAEGTVFTVTAGGTLVVDETLLPGPVKPAVGSVRGTVVDDTTGSPIPGACVSLRRTVTLIASAVVGRTCADAAGAYVFPQVPVSSALRVWAEATGYATAFAGAVQTEVGSVGQAVTAGAATTLAFRLRAGSGSLRGRVLTPGGEPSPLSTVSAVSEDGAWAGRGLTRADGTYTMPNVPAGRYRVGFGDDSVVTGGSPLDPPVLWWPGKTDQGAAEYVTVPAGSSATVDERLLPATLAVTVVDTAGRPVTDVCVHFSTQASQCDSATGVYSVVVPPGSYTARVADSVRYFTAPAVTLAAASGQTISATIVVEPGAVFTMNLRSRVDEGRAPAVCAIAVPVDYAAGPVQDIASCNNAGAEPTARLEIGPVRGGGAVQLLLWSPDGRHGAQWVGPAGGLGDRTSAARLTPVVGARTSTPPGVLDAPAILEVTLQNLYPDTIIERCVDVLGVAHLVGNSPLAGCLGEGAVLGPYQWPVRATSMHHATTWSGNAPNRFAAKKADLRDGHDAVTISMAAGRELEVELSGEVPGQDYDVSAFDAITGDRVSFMNTGQDPTGRRLRGLNRSAVLVRVTDGSRSCWYAGNSVGTRRARSAQSVFPPDTYPYAKKIKVDVGAGCVSATPALVSPVARRAQAAAMLVTTAVRATARVAAVPGPVGTRPDSVWGSPTAARLALVKP